MTEDQDGYILAIPPPRAARSPTTCPKRSPQPPTSSSPGHSLQRSPRRRAASPSPGRRPAQRAAAPTASSTAWTTGSEPWPWSM